MPDKNPRIPKTVNSHPAFKGPKRLREEQAGWSSIILSREYPKTCKYVNVALLDFFPRSPRVQSPKDLDPHRLCRVGFAITSTFAGENGMKLVVSKINSLLALYTKLKAGKCLDGREGSSCVTYASERVRKAKSARCRCIAPCLHNPQGFL